MHPLASVGRDRTVRLWDLRTATPRAVVSNLDADVRAVAITGDGSRLVVATNTGRVRSWPLPSEWASLACRTAGRSLLEAELTRFDVRVPGPCT